jgi:hypothetical protein
VRQVLFIDGPMRGEFREYGGHTIAFAEPIAPAEVPVRDISCFMPVMEVGYYHVHECIAYGQRQYVASVIAQVEGNERELMNRLMETVAGLPAHVIWQQFLPQASYHAPDRIPARWDRPPGRHYCGAQGCWYTGQGFSHCEPGECVQAGREYQRH